MALGLPEDGEITVEKILLPVGRRVYAEESLGPSDKPVAWITNDPISEPGHIWSALFGVSKHSGYIPFLLTGRDRNEYRPWDEEDLDEPGDLRQIELTDISALLQRQWEKISREADAAEVNGGLANFIDAKLQPFSRQFPGLAPAVNRPGDASALKGALASLPPAHLGLAEATRPADVLPTIGWWGAQYYDDAIPVAAVLRSWEDRFGAKLLEVGLTSIRLLVERPPASRDEALRLAAEQVAFAAEYAADTIGGLDTVSSIAAAIVDARIWGLSWA